MSRKSKLVKALQKSFRQISKKFLSAINKQIIWLLRTIFGIRRRRSSENAGFLLPTVAMVSLVVVLLTTAILFRSFERSKNASNVRVNETVLQAATPALDRAKAKITALFADPTLPRAVPSDGTLYSTMINKLTTYTLGDETSLIVGYDLDKDNNIEAPKDGLLESKEVLETAWKFPVDTDNDGKFDSFTLYGIYFRNPPYASSAPQRKRSPLEARTVPLAGKVCDSSGDTSASLIGGSSWYKVTTGELKKSFFIYTAIVPITDISSFDSTIKDKYQAYKGNQGFSAIELQQDRKQIPLTNNSVVYEDDLDITPGPAFRMNGRMFTNSNFFTRKNTDPNPIRFFQVSSIESCYYERENGKIIIGGNVATNGAITDSEVGGSSIDLFKDNAVPAVKALTSPEKSTTNIPNEIAYNSRAYAERIDLLVKAQFARDKGNDPQIVKDNIDRRTTKDPSLDAEKVRKQELQVYFRQRTRRVPFREVFLGTSGILKTAPSTLYATTEVLQGKDNTANKSNDDLRPLDVWMYPTDTNTKLTLSTSQLTAIDPETVDKSPVEEKELGDRILVGNNLPELRWDSTLKEFLGEDVPQEISGQTWKDSTKTRTRTTRVKQLADLGASGRDGYWETSAANSRADVLDVLGGLRVVTGAGVYSPGGSNLPTPSAAANNTNTPENEDKAPVVWSDAMQMVVPDPTAPLDTSKQTRGHLVMRATAVYHYNKDPYDPLKDDNYQEPIACVSSYYNPTNLATATTDGYDPSDPTKADKSNNGFSYTVSTTTSANVTRGLTTNSDGLFTTTGTKDNVATKAFDLQERLKYQANLVFPNSQFVNPLLRQALKKATDQPLTLSEQSAIDSTICALQITDGTLTRDNSIVPDKAIKETAFLDARQIKAIDKVALSGQYDLEIEQRQPLEIRATVLDLNLLRKTAITGTWANEYLLPNSGIIYAARDDAQPDTSDPTSADVSASDYKLDPNRRPNAIMLINGSQLNRGTGGTENDYRPEEKGLILATDLPAYVKDAFNIHSQQEFTTPLLNSGSDWDSNFYARYATNRNPNFACRPKDPRLPKCTAGETWRPASVLADAVTLLSSSFKEGYRNEGDFDLRNNRTDTSDAVDPTKNVVRKQRLKNGFWDNNFVTSRNFTDSTYKESGAAATANSSYFNNFVTPIQRRVSFPEYVMEMCFNLNVAECTDWYVGYDLNGDGTITDSESKVKSADLPADADATKLVAGTTSTNNPPKAGYEKFPRRVAFKRDKTSGELLDVIGDPIFKPSLSASPVALGIVSSKVDASGAVPTSTSNALWFTTVVASDTANPPASDSKFYNNTTRLFYSFPSGADGTSQPLLEPILQINVPKKSPDSTSDYGSITDLNSVDNRVKNTSWLPKAVETTFNLVIAAGDTPSRVGNSSTINFFETNGGFHNFPRFLENWDSIASKITGSFIQFKRSAYATAPYQALIKIGAGGNHEARSLFSERNNFYYHSDSTFPQGGAPYYMPPLRNWGFDVALLSQNPDLFAQRFVTPSTDAPDNYYREVSRDDRWVQALLCSTQETTNKDGFGSGFDIKIEDTVANTTTTKSTNYALPATQRPTTCPVVPD
ncbi:hormogonium polysaccharide biosynthesis protein HpsA [Nostoc favosum]|uniref:Hormogonium polysaccharide biosynthesis protein HpsA n=1 Tax=Nostoc favosum CHAB5714 TaxID=2780399 RepID=A0ABS8IDA1_9NOSO|nr:hormogonium polysaccharide biosynthesis protein HpsA [Nostoc favosum]MCC5602195.1 hormogonium polysaccharide biosynthesis protein HpsA [Nostoc favosum CHAB5714]